VHSLGSGSSLREDTEGLCARLFKYSSKGGVDVSIFKRTRLSGLTAVVKATLLVAALAVLCAFAAGCGGGGSEESPAPTTGTAKISVDDTTGAARITVE